MLEVVVVKSAPFDSVIEFQVTGGNLSAMGAFPAGVSSPNSMSVFFQIPDDIIGLEPDEMISLDLSLLEANPQISVDPDTATVTIVDNDGESLAPQVMYSETRKVRNLILNSLPKEGRSTIRSVKCVSLTKIDAVLTLRNFQSDLLN